MIGVSEEVLWHHVGEHRRTCAGTFQHADQMTECPCGHCRVLLCGGCHGPVLLSLDRDTPPCEHAEIAIKLFGTPTLAEPAG